jgi:hypothetical protein
MMTDSDADRHKAIRAVEALFQRYRILARKRPDDHLVSDYCLFLQVFRYI